MVKRGRECCRRSPKTGGLGPDGLGNMGRVAVETGGCRSFISSMGEVEDEPRRYDSRLAMGTAVCKGGKEILDSIRQYLSGEDNGGLLGPAELGELVLLTVVCDRPLGEGEGERSVAQCFETEDVGTLRLVVLIGGVYSMRRDERMCMSERT
jgi:hypothetical protein